MPEADFDLEIAQDLAGHPRFEWVEGMLTQSGRRTGFRAGDLPVLSDLATAGCLLGLVDAQGVLTDVVRQEDGWIVAVELPGGLKGFAADHLGEAASWALMEAWAELGEMVSD